MKVSSPAGYSGTPLVGKLGLKPHHRVLLLDAPDEFVPLLQPLPADIVFERDPGPAIDIAHVFVRDRQRLAKHLATLRQSLRPDAALWVSWPKKSARIPSDVTEDRIRELALPLGFVDVKVCAISAVWSGLKLVVRKSLR